MKLIRVKIISADTCGGLLDGLDVGFRSPFDEYSSFDPLCLIGPNGSGKSQFLQVLAEIFQSIFHTCLKEQERLEGNPDLQFEIEYFIYSIDEQSSIRVRISRQAKGKKRQNLIIQKRDEEEYDWINCELDDPKTHGLLPQKIVGYTSGDNETLSHPFLLSRRGYAGDVASPVLYSSSDNPKVYDTRLMLIDYGTNFEVLVANLLLGDSSHFSDLLMDINLQDLHSFRCIVQLAHRVAPANPKKNGRKKEIWIPQELEDYIEKLKKCSTSYFYEDTTKTYIFDYWVNAQTREAFRYFWESTLELYTTFHKLAMLNDLALPKSAREIFTKKKSNDFASRLPEPLDEDKVFRFEWVRFISQKAEQELGYVSLSDGEHQLLQLLGIFYMLSSPNILFLLDEPESHFNPQWRVQFISKILNLPTQNGDRREKSLASQQDCLITTHAPFIPSDMQRDKVFIFSKTEDEKIKIKNPEIKTFGATFDTIIEECFNVSPPISQVSRDEINTLMESEDPKMIKAGIQKLGDSVQKVFLVDHLRQVGKGL